MLNQYINLKDNHTCIIISHRVGICKKADKIFVMDKGKIVEQGTHSELIEKKVSILIYGVLKQNGIIEVNNVILDKI